jgi:hypothetical protein
LTVAPVSARAAIPVENVRLKIMSRLVHITLPRLSGSEVSDEPTCERPVPTPVRAQTAAAASSAPARPTRP